MFVSLVLVSCLLGVLLILFIRIKLLTRRMQKFADKLPQAPNIPVFGVAHKFFKVRDTVEILKKIQDLQECGSAVAVWYFYKLHILTNDPKVVQNLLTSPDAVEKADVYKFFAGNLGGVFMASRENWHTMRKALNLTFNPKRMEEYMNVFNEQGTVLMDVLERSEGRFYDPHHQIARCLIDILIETHFGIKTHEQELNTGKVCESMASSIQYTFLRGSKIWLFPDFIYKRSKYYHEARKIRAPTSKFFRTVIEDSLKRNEIGEDYNDNEYVPKPKQLYIDMISDWVKKRGMVPDAQLLRCLICDIIIAGFDTTSTSLAHLLYNLASHPEVQDRVHEEIDRVLGDNKYGPIQKQEFLQMNYLDMALKETLRKFAPPFVVRKLYHDLETDHGILPAGCSPYINIYSLHHNPLYWEKPSEFYPEHFLPEAVAERPKFAYIPFSAGPRNCPGMLYANWVIKVLAVMILRKYRVETNVRSEDMKYKFVLMLDPIDGFSIKFTPRS